MNRRSLLRRALGALVAAPAAPGLVEEITRPGVEPAGGLAVKEASASERSPQILHVADIPARDCLMGTEDGDVCLTVDTSEYWARERGKWTRVSMCC